MPRVLVIGDDLTGSNATGARFARAGLRTTSVSGVDRASRAMDSDVLVLNAGTRHLGAAAARARVQEAAKAVAPVELLAKRVDTTLRGNVGAEVDAWFSGKSIPIVRCLAQPPIAASTPAPPPCLPRPTR